MQELFISFEYGLKKSVILVYLLIGIYLLIDSFEIGSILTSIG